MTVQPQPQLQPQTVQLQAVQPTQYESPEAIKRWLAIDTIPITEETLSDHEMYLIGKDVIAACMNVYAHYTKIYAPLKLDYRMMFHGGVSGRCKPDMDGMNPGISVFDIYLHHPLFRKNPKEYEWTIIHECCHAFASHEVLHTRGQSFDQKENKPHGRRWKQWMARFDQEPAAFHNMNVEEYKRYHPRPFIYECSCAYYFLSPASHSKVVEGYSYIRCRDCNEQATFLRRDPNWKKREPAYHGIPKALGLDSIYTRG